MVAQSDRALLLSAAFVGIILRIAFLILYGGGAALQSVFLPEGADQPEYWGLAESLLRGDGLLSNSYCWGEPNVPYLYRPPLYPIWLATCMAMTGNRMWAIRCIQLAFSLGFIPLAYAFCRLTRQSRLPTAVVLLTVACNPLLIYFSLIFQAEAIYYVLFAAAQVGLLACLLQPQDKRAWLLAGALTAVAGLTRGEAIYSAVVVLLASYLLIRPGPGWKGPVGFGLMVCLCLTPWSVRNALVSGQWIWIQRGAIELANVMSTSPESTGVESAAYKLWEAQTLEEWRSLPDNARVGYLRSRLAEFIPSHPYYYAKALSSKVVDLWHPIPRSVRAEGPGRTKGIILWGSYGLLIPFFFLGLWSLRKQPRVTIVILGYVLCNLAIGIIGTTGFRIRLQIHFLFLCVAGLGLSRAFQARSERSAG